MAEIVLDDLAVSENGQSHRTVRIAQRYEIANQLYQVIAFMSDNNVRIARMSDDTRAKSFQLSAEEMDTLATQWMQFRSDCISTIEIERNRLAKVKAEAFKIVGENALIKVSEEADEYSRSYWHVYIEEIGFSQEAYNPDQLFASVNCAIERYIEHTFQMNEAKEIVQKHPEITIKNVARDKMPPRWDVVIPSLDWESPSYARTGSELLNTVNDAVKRLEEHKAENATNGLVNPDITSQHNAQKAAHTAKVSQKDEIKRLVAQHPTLAIQQDSNGTIYRVSDPTNHFEAYSASGNAAQLLEGLQEHLAHIANQ